MSVNVYTPYLSSSQREKMKKTGKNNDQNYQISALFGILRQILEKIYLQDVYNCKMYIKVYRYIKFGSKFLKNL